MRVWFGLTCICLLLSICACSQIRAPKPHEPLTVESPASAALWRAYDRRLPQEFVKAFSPDYTWSVAQAAGFMGSPLTDRAWVASYRSVDGAELNFYHAQLNGLTLGLVVTVDKSGGVVDIK